MLYYFSQIQIFPSLIKPLMRAKKYKTNMLFQIQIFPSLIKPLMRAKKYKTNMLENPCK
jgi:hypothetical protein